MIVYRGFEHIGKLENPVVAIGSFDGVHLGHCCILRYLCDTARQCGGQSVVITFDPHPQVLVRPDSDFFAINPLDMNLSLIAKQGVDVVVVVPFTQSFSELSYTEFIENHIIGKLHAKTLVMGPNHALGHNREGDRAKIEELCQKYNVSVVDIPEFLLDNAKVHSSTIRKLIQKREFNKVDELLGYHWESKTQNSN